MQSNKEHFGILSELIEMAKSDNVIKAAEYDFILDVAKELGIDKKTVDDLFENTHSEHQPRSLEQRIDRLHRLIVLMNIDGHQHPLEVERLQVIGLRIGLKPSIILKVIEEVNKNPGEVLSVETLFNFTK